MLARSLVFREISNNAYDVTIKQYYGVLTAKGVVDVYNENNIYIFLITNHVIRQQVTTNVASRGWPSAGWGRIWCAPGAPGSASFEHIKCKKMNDDDDDVKFMISSDGSISSCAWW